MKGILLAGGLGTRLYPMTHVVNKHVLPLYDRPMFYWPLQTLIDSGIKDITVVSGPPTGNQMKEALQFFPHRKSVKLTFVLQEKPLGMPHAIFVCRKFVGKHTFIVSVGDNLFGGNFKREVERFSSGTVAFIRKVKDPSCFGVASFDEKGRIKNIVEKPKEFVGEWAVGAPYIFDNTAFNKIEKMVPSKRGELEIVDLLNLYLKEKKLRLIKRRDIWMDAGTPESLLEASLAARKILKQKA